MNKIFLYGLTLLLVSCSKEFDYDAQYSLDVTMSANRYSEKIKFIEIYVKSNETRNNQYTHKELKLKKMTCKLVEKEDIQKLLKKLRAVNMSAMPIIPKVFESSYHIIFHGKNGQKGYAIVDSKKGEPSFLTPWSSATVYVNENISEYLEELLPFQASTQKKWCRKTEPMTY